jgi:xanthine/uracil permease
MDLSFLMSAVGNVYSAVMGVVTLAFGLALLPVIVNWFLGDGFLHLHDEARISYPSWLPLGNVWVTAPTLAALMLILSALHIAH